MISVGELKTICERIEKEYGSDCNVIIQIYNDDGSLNTGSYCIDYFRNSSGELFLMNHKFKNGSCL